MEDKLIQVVYLLSRYLHIVASGLLVGGTLFYELIVPVAIDDLRDEQKLSVFARARWAFRGIVWFSAAALLISGAISSYRNWHAYTSDPFVIYAPAAPQPATRQAGLEQAGHWWVAHASVALIGLIIALLLVKGRTPPRYPIVWMRINLLVLLVAIFMASTTRHVRLRLMEGHLPPPPVALD